MLSLMHLLWIGFIKQSNYSSGFSPQDVIGKRGYLAMLTAVLTIPVFGLLAFSDVYPLVSTIWLGFTYSFAAVGDSYFGISFASQDKP